MTPHQDETLTLDALKGIYEHVTNIRNDELSFNSIYLQKIHKLMTVQVLLFASMSYASGQLEWIKENHIIHSWILAITAGLGGLCLIIGFYYCIKCLGIEKVSVIGVTKLEQFLSTGKIKEVPSTEVYLNLSENVAKSIKEQRERREKRSPWGPIVNKTTQIGFLFITVFVTYSVCGRVITSVIPLEK